MLRLPEGDKKGNNENEGRQCIRERGCIWPAGDKLQAHR